MRSYLVDKRGSLINAIATLESSWCGEVADRAWCLLWLLIKYRHCLRSECLFVHFALNVWRIIVSSNRERKDNCRAHCASWQSLHARGRIFTRKRRDCWVKIPKLERFMLVGAWVALFSIVLNLPSGEKSKRLPA